jgi:hypothetical protein
VPAKLFLQLIMNKRSCLLRVIVLLIIVACCFDVKAQDERAQIPKVLQNSYFEVNIGYINYPFDASHLEPGYTFESVKVPHTAVRLLLIGYEFNRYLAAQISYMRPVLWVNYTYSNGAEESNVSRAVWMNVGAVTVKPQLPLGKKVTLYGEAGLAIITRNGFEDYSGNPVVANANYASVLYGGGIKYHVNDRWGLMLSMVQSPENTEKKQPSTTFLAAGFSYKLLPLTDARLEKAAKAGYIHPKQWVQLGLTSNSLGYGVNNFFSEGDIPIFWGGEAEVAYGFTLGYQRNIYHGARVFSLDWGANIAYWMSNENRESFFTVSLYPVFRWNYLHLKAADLYFFYSVAGPTFISKTDVDGKVLGEKFTFQDMIGTGTFLGANRRVNLELRIGHYSNGNIFPGNEGVKIPLTLSTGITF